MDIGSGSAVSQHLLNELTDLRLAQRQVTDLSQLALLDSDLVFRAQRHPVMVLRPAAVDEVSAMVRACERSGASVEVRGAGLSYSGGYLAQDDRTVVLDMSALTGIRYHPGSEQVVCVEAGVTWLALDKWLSGSGRRVGLLPPISGSVSTIGASLRQGMPSDMSAVLAVEIVTPAGEVMRTGALAVDSAFSPLWRGQGPDLTGLFLGDCGVFGVLTRAWLRLDPEPASRGFFACALPDPALFPELLHALQTPQAMVRGYCFDPGRSRALRAQPVREQVAVGLRVLSRQRGLRARFRGVIDLIKTATAVGGGNPGESWGAHFVFESDAAERVAAVQIKARQFARARHAPLLATTVAEALASRPYSVRGALGPGYERWAPVSAVFDRCHAPRVIPVVHSALARVCVEAGVPGLTSSMLMLGAGADHLVLEPMLLWPSGLYPLHHALIPKAHAGGVLPDPARDKAVRDARAELAGLMDELGGQHVQLGRFYDYQERLPSAQLSLLAAIKSQLDPQCRHAPGSLGFAPSSRT